MMSLWKHLSVPFVATGQSARWSDAVRRLYGALWAWRFARLQRELRRIDVFKRHAGAPGNRDTLFHLSHRYYLSSRFSYRQRIECALTHYRYEAARLDERRKDAIYSGQGVTLWSCTIGSATYTLRLRATSNPPNEGGNSVVLEVNNLWLGEMSFVWLEGTVIGAPAGILPFITRNQTVHRDSPRLCQFREMFPHNSPAYFCLAALHGVAIAYGHQHIAGIDHACQIAFEPQYSESFRHSYTEFWQAFGGVALGAQAHLMPVPLAHPPLPAVQARHRKRALARRRHWANIAHSAALAMAAPNVAADHVPQTVTLSVSPNMVQLSSLLLATLL